MNEQTEALALKSIEHAALLAVSNPLLFRGSVGRDLFTERIIFQVFMPLSAMNVEMWIDPLPLARAHIELDTVKANAATNEKYLGRAVFETIRRFVGFVAVDAVDATLATHCEMGPTIAVDDIAAQKIDASVLRLPGNTTKGCFAQLDTQRAVIRGRGGANGRPPILGDQGEERAIRAITSAIPQFVEMKKQYRALKSEWEQDRQRRKLGYSAEEWETHWREKAGPQTFAHLSEDVLHLFCSKKFRGDAEERSDNIFIACVHTAPIFGIKPKTLEKKYHEWDRTLHEQPTQPSQSFVLNPAS